MVEKSVTKVLPRCYPEIDTMAFKSAIAEAIGSELLPQNIEEQLDKHSETKSILREIAQYDPAEELRQAIRQARDWLDLSGILDRTQAAFERDEVSRDQAE